MIYIIIFFLLLGMELLYFKIADHFNIIDKPSERSSHDRVVLRGGGIIFYVTGLFYFIYSDFQYPWFFLGLTMIAIVSFLDDIFTLSNRVRLLIHFFSLLSMAYELQIFQMQWIYLLATFVIVVGILNAYNFMDGINGITAIYSLVVGGLLLWMNQEVGFVDSDMLIFALLGVLVFAFFNFRSTARSFAGDVGSVTIAFILSFSLGALILKTGNLIYILFLAVYGVDTIWTLVHRIYRRENIFVAHRTHLYQYLANEAKVNKLLVSVIYATIQLGIGWGVVVVSEWPVNEQIWISLALLIVLSAVYWIAKRYIVKKYSNITSSNYDLLLKEISSVSETTVRARNQKSVVTSEVAEV